ncbi:MAG: hypothetical protein WBX15_14880 [Thermoanaerobaculia bacterium]
MFQRSGSASMTILAVSLLGFALIGCEWDFPLTPEPTREVVPQLTGDWFSLSDGARLTIRQLDPRSYVVVSDGEPYRVIHTDLGGAPLVSVQQLQDERKWVWYSWHTSDDGNTLELRYLDPKFIRAHASDRAAIVRFVEENLKNPQLYGETLRFARVEK